MGNLLVSALTDLAPGTPVRGLLLDNMFSDRPEVLDAVRDARRRGVPYATIAVTISRIEGVTVSASAVRNWVKAQGL